MSDLLQLVAAALNDKVAAEAHEELTALRKDLNVSRSVEVVRAIDNGDGEHEDEEAVVYASAQFQDGSYSHNPYQWQVDFDRGSVTCRLADLRNCHLCVGGGFPLASLDDQLPNSAPYQGFLHMSEADGDNSKTVLFSFCPHTIWLTIVVHGWPREEWEAVVQANNVLPEECIQFLVETVASEHPEATVEFLGVSFVVGSIHGALKRLLPPKRRKQVRAERDERDTEENRAYSDLGEFVARTMRARGDTRGPALFIPPQRDNIMDILTQLGIREHNGNNEETISTIIAAYEDIGPEGFAEVFRRVVEANYGGEDESVGEAGDATS